MLPPLQGRDYSSNSIEFSPDGSKIILGSSDKTIHVWDENTGVEMCPPPSPQKADEVSVSTLDCQIISLDQGWFTNSITGRCLGRLPVGPSYYGWLVQRSYFIGWTGEHKLVILRFPDGI